MMDNLARIISHGFAIVVVILLGLGFIYRGELFPDLELPDFLLPESERVADTGDHVNKLQPESTVTQGKVASEPVEAAASTPVAPLVEAPATAPETGVETLQAPVEEVPPPVAEESGPAGGTTAGIGEAGSTPATEGVPVPVPSEETPAEPQPELPGSGAGTQPVSAAAETAPEEPVISREAAPQTASQTPVAGEKSSPVEASAEGAAPTAEMTVPGSGPVTPEERQPGISNAGHSPRGSTTEVKPYELLASAREAFWLHNYDDAEKNYRALTELEPQNPDGYGELGNMYFSQGRWEDAAAAYYEAGIRLVGEGRLDSARELVNVIRGLNGKQADELDKLITSAETTGNH